MSTHKQPAISPRHRSSSVNRDSSYNNRPRSLGYYGASTSPYSSLYSNSSNPYPAKSEYNTYSSDYKSPYFSNTSRGFASLKIPAKSFLNTTPNYSRAYDNNNTSKSGKNDASHISRRDATKVDIDTNRNRSVSRSRNSSAGGGLSSRSISLTSLNSVGSSSQGYISGNERNHRSRVNSTADIRNKNGEIDYKMLYEQQLADNEKLKEKLGKSVEDLRDAKENLERLNVVTSKNSLSELEKRERRAMERKLSEMEEELKQLQKLKAENERLKADNRSLTRVINKLIGSPK